MPNKSTKYIPALQLAMSAPFAAGFHDVRNGRPFRPVYETESLGWQTAYEMGRLVAVVHGKRVATYEAIVNTMHNNREVLSTSRWRDKPLTA